MQVPASGQNFTTDAHVIWNGPGGTSSPLQTQFQSAALLQATVPASYLTSPGVAQISVGNSIGSSNYLPFQITVPTPSISSISPASAAVGSPQVGLTVNGSNFINGAQIKWSGPGGFSTNLQTQFQSTALLQATVPASYLVSPGTASMSVSNSGVISNSVGFQISATPPAPQVTALSPRSVAVGVNSFNLFVFGSNFTSSSAVLWNGSYVVTTFIGPTELSASIPAAFVLSPGSPVISVNASDQTSNGINLSVTNPTGANFYGELMTATPPPTNGTCGDPIASYQFTKENGFAFLFFYGTTSASDLLYNDWVGPDGSVIPGGNWSQVTGTYCFTDAGLEIANTPANRLGLWQARVYDNGNMIFWLSFMVNN